MSGRLSRRELLLAAVGAAAASCTAARRPAVAARPQTKTPPGDRITVACLGVGSQGLRVMMNFLAHPDVQVVAVCDVNKGSDDYSEWGKHELRDKVRALLGAGYSTWGGEGEPYRGGIAGRGPARDIVEAYYGAETRSGTYSGCAEFEDYRELVAKRSDIDAVVIGAPDHLHAPMAIAAMRAGKHVFCQKPMAHSVFEARRMADVARDARVATQVAVGNQASEATRLLCEWIWAGGIGPVREVINWSSRPFWPQGISRPDREEPAPSHLNWDLWLGPAAARPYHHAYQPFVWRGWYDFGTGALGDMGCYSFDTIVRVLKLGPPTSVEASSTERLADTFPKASIIHFEFPARGDMPPVRLTWYDGGLKPPRPEELDEPFEAEGLLFVGDEGKILCGFNGARPRLIPAARMQAYQPPPKTLPRSPGNDREWIDACKGGPAGGASFEFTAGVTEAVLLGNVAARTGERLLWDSAGFTITNLADANRYLQRQYRQGWAV
ncbi:MAG: Gfo/Idh/MocA family protein [Vicinamibacterales bacterium]